MNWEELVTDLKTKPGNFLCPACLEPFMTRQEKRAHMERDHGYDVLETA